MAGILEGTFSDFGSYDECMEIRDNEIIGQTQYCTLDMRPILPPRPRYHNLVYSLDYYHNFTSVRGRSGQVSQHITQLASSS